MSTSMKPSPDFFSDENLGTGALVADIVTRLAALIVVGLRFLSRYLGGTKYGWDDYLILASVGFGITGLGIESRMVNLGVGRHLGWLLTNQPEGLSDMAKLLYADQLLYAPIIALVKLSLLALYLRLFGITSKKAFRWVCYVQIVAVLLWAVVTELLFIFQCRPIWVAWSPDRQGGTCFEFASLFLGTNIVNVIMDFTILVTPLPSIWTLRLPIVKKTFVTGVLVLGAATLALSILRVVKLSVLTFQDATIDYSYALLYSTIEANLGTICVCLPVMAPLLTSTLPCLKKRMSSSNKNQGKRQAYALYGGYSADRSKTREVESGSEYDNDQRELVAHNSESKGIRHTTTISISREQAQP